MRLTLVDRKLKSLSKQAGSLNAREAFETFGDRNSVLDNIVAVH